MGKEYNDELTMISDMMIIRGYDSETIKYVEYVIAVYLDKMLNKQQAKQSLYAYFEHATEFSSRMVEHTISDMKRYCPELVQVF